MKEHKKKCDGCKKRRQSRIFYKKIKGMWMHLCKECWEEMSIKDMKHENKMFDVVYEWFGKDWSGRC